MTKDLVTERLKLKDLYPERAEALAKEHDINIEDLELVRKGIVAEKAEVDKDERAVISYITTGTKDRDNEIIEPDGAILTYYRKNPVVPWAHDYRALPVGKNIWIKKDKKGLIAKTIFLKHQFADDVYRLYSDDVAGTGPAMKAWSIGFVPLKWEFPERKGDTDETEHDTRLRKRYKIWELLEYSPVPIPSNREALTEMVEKGLIKSEKLKRDIGDILVEVVNRDPDIKEDGTPWLYTNEAGTLVTQEEILEEWIEKEVVTKPEETDDYIRLPAKGEEGKHKGHKIRWITVSEKEGIRGIYCIDCKKIITYVFMKDKGWTLAKAKKWMKDHGKNIKVETIKAYGKEIVFITEGDRTLDFIAPEGTDNLDSFDFLKDKREDIYSTGNEGVIELEDESKKLMSFKAKPKEDYEYLLHHIETDDDGKEEIHHCLVYDHIANMFEQAHLLIKDGKAYLDGKKIKEGLFHVVKGLEPTQETVWSDEEAKENKIKPKKMRAGMTLKEKSKEW